MSGELVSRIIIRENIIMKNSKRIIQRITIAAAIMIFGLGTVFAVQAAGSANSSDLSAKTSHAAGNLAVQKSEAETKAVISVPMQETESITEAEVTTEPQTEAAVNYNQETTAVQPVTEAPTEAPVLSADQINSNQAQSNASTYASYINQVYSLINQERAAAGVNSVAYDSTLTLMSCHRAIENANNNSMTVSDGHHIRPDGQKASTIAVYYGQYGSFGENLGRYQTSPEEIVKGWHKSSAHYTCMINSKYTRVGVGVAQDSEGNYYWTAIFMS